jgi:(p)ppGpp synthase/HD superfamily hydrolase
MQKTVENSQKAQKLSNEYKEKRYLFEEYTKKIRLLLENLLKKNQIQFQTIQFRTKEVPNFYEKLLRKKELQDMNIFEMTDLSARALKRRPDDVEHVFNGRVSLR